MAVWYWGVLGRDSLSPGLMPSSKLRLSMTEIYRKFFQQRPIETSHGYYRNLTHLHCVFFTMDSSWYHCQNSCGQLSTYSCIVSIACVYSFFWWKYFLLLKLGVTPCRYKSKYIHLSYTYCEIYLRVSVSQYKRDSYCNLGNRCQDSTSYDN